MFEKLLYAGWGDMDFNSHMRNTAYSDKSGDVRMMFFFENSFPMQEFMKLKIGPVVMKDELEYFREVALLESLRATLQLAGCSDDGSRFKLRNEFFLSNGKLAAKVTSWGGWLDLVSRKLIVPPEALMKVVSNLTRTDDFENLPSSIR